MSDKNRVVRPYYYNEATAAWEVVPEGSTPPPSRFNSATPFRVSTLNVLADIFPKPVEMVIQSPLRRQNHLEIIEKLDATILGLNEVTITILTKLLSSPFIQRNYYVSEAAVVRCGTGHNSNNNNDNDVATSTSAMTHKPNGTFGPHGCLILSKIPFEEIWVVDTTQDDRKNARDAVVGVFRVGDIINTTTADTGGVNGARGEYFAVASQHTLAYQNEINYLKRKTQIANMCDFLVSHLDKKSGGRTAPKFVLMGDLNMHYVCEDGFVVENNLVDLWAETNFDAATNTFPDGYTYDSQTNGMVPHYVPGENRRMRLDRLLCTPAFLSTFAAQGRCKMWATDAVDASRCIWPSDHYGLTIDLATTTPPREYTPNPAVRTILEANAKIPREKPTYNLWKFAGALPYHVWFLGKRLANY